ncbi:MAG: carboxypeptidase-like regulatory domain-containing protein [Planctomycetota bacterium]
MKRGGYTVAGVVLDAQTGAPIAGASVTAYASTGAPQVSIVRGKSDSRAVCLHPMPTMMRTDAHGLFEFRDLHFGTIVFKARGRGYAEARCVADAPRGDGFVTIALPREAGVLGVARSQNEESDEARIALNCVIEVFDAGGVRIASTGTDAQGRFRLRGLPPGPVSMTAVNLGHEWARREVNLVEGTNRVNLALAVPVGPIARLTNSSGEVVSGLSIAKLGNGMHGKGVYVTTSNTNGEVWVSGLTEMPALFQVWSDSVSGTSFPLCVFSAGGGGCVTVSVPMAKAELRIAGGERLAKKVSVRVQQEATGFGLINSIEPGGVWDIGQLAEGNYSVYQVEASGVAHYCGEIHTTSSRGPISRTIDRQDGRWILRR